MNTIENAMIVPFIFLVILAIFELELYMLDVAKVMSFSSMTSSYYSTSIDKSESLSGEYNIKKRNAAALYLRTHVEDEMRVLDNFDEDINGKLLLLKSSREEASIMGSRIVLDIKMSANHPLFRRFNISPINYGIKLKTEVSNYADVIRKKVIEKRIKETVKNEEQGS
ncbi:MAG: hypothetical protein K5656_08125 [Lachnospiraceae bacterium]|nr:hypothetical protein [Lachnospiraceae bacterium]